MPILTEDGFWPLMQPTPTSATERTGKTPMNRFVEMQELRAKARVAQIVGSYDVDNLRQLGLSDEDIRGLISSRYAGTR